MDRLRASAPHTSPHEKTVLLKVERESVQTTYTENPRSMLRYVYDCVFFVARKPADVYYHSPEDTQPAVKSPRRDVEGAQT